MELTSWTTISYRDALKQEKQDRASVSQNGLVPNLRAEEHSALLHNRNLSSKQKELLLDWVDVLFEDLQVTPPNRGACLDGIAIIIERYADYTVVSTKAGRRLTNTATAAS